MRWENTNENDSKIQTNGILKYDPNLCDPMPYEPMNSMVSGFAMISDKMQEKLNELNEKERNLDRNILSSSKEIDEKYNSLQKKIDSDLLNLSNREKELEKGFKKLKELEEKFEKDSNLINEKNKSKIYSELENELRGIENEIRNLDSISDKLTKLETGIQATPDTIMVNYASLLSISKEIKTSISKLRERVDNNIFK